MGLTNDLRTRRTARGWSQAELAACVGVSRQTINSIEQGRYLPSLPLAITLARQFQTTVEEMFHVEPALEPTAGRRTVADG